MEIDVGSTAGPAPPPKQRTAWTEAVEASYQRSTPARSELTPAVSPEPSEPDSALPSASVAEVSLTDYSGQRLEYARPLGVYQSVVAPHELGYPSGLHRLGRLMVMTVVTSLCLYRHTGPLLSGLVFTPPPLPPLDIETFVGGVRLNVI